MAKTAKKIEKKQSLGKPSFGEEVLRGAQIAVKRALAERDLLLELQKIRKKI